MAFEYTAYQMAFWNGAAFSNQAGAADMYINCTQLYEILFHGISL